MPSFFSKMCIRDRVCDLQADNLELQLATTRETLESLEIGETPILTVFNKCDNTKCIESLPAGISREGAVFVSARTGYNLDGLLQKICLLYTSPHGDHETGPGRLLPLRLPDGPGQQDHREEDRQARRGQDGRLRRQCGLRQQGDLR